ncbi:MAG: VWA domain-containing protein [Candidatus Woesearchaeota archaeon]|nr:VWA domain-containing protein [Candidatus Woesearchaeota archaeon]
MSSREVTLEIGSTSLDEGSEAEELTGKMGSDPDEERLAHSVLENDEETIKDGQLLAESADYALGSFTPDLMFEALVKNYQSAKHMYGPTIIRALTGFEGDYIEKNKNIREFNEQLEQNIYENVGRLQEKGLLDNEGSVTKEGFHLASLVMYTEELDHLRAHGLGKKETKERAHYGDKADRVPFKKHRYKDLDIRASLHRAMRRGHTTLEQEDLKAVERKQHGKISVVYAIDSSGSMKGKKLHIGKKAGIALAYRAIADQNDVGLVIFTNDISQSIPPTQDFGSLLLELTKAKAGQETDLALAIEHATQLFGRADTKHLVLLTDAMPTSGKDPGQKALEMVTAARDAGVTVSVVGINLEKEGEKLAKRMVEIGEGKMYQVKNLDELDLIILEDYEGLKEKNS